MEIKGTALLAKALTEEGVEVIFGYPGGYAIDIFDELYQQNSIDIVLPRHEQGLIHAADGYARSTGKTGVCIVTSGPGATNLVTGIATANYDSVPLVCFTGQVPTYLIGNDAFQEVDIIGITRNICKYGITVRDRKDLGRIIKEAFYIAGTGKPGPVIVDLPKDVIISMGDSTYPQELDIRGYKPSFGVHKGQLKRAVKLLHQAKKPVLLIGGGVNISKANEELTKLVDKTKVPVVTTIMGKGAIDTLHPYYVGNIGMHGSYAANTAISQCDMLFSIGTRFNDRITGKVSEFAKNAKTVHIDIDTASIARNVRIDIPIVADAKTALEAMLNIAKECETNDWIREINQWKDLHPITSTDSFPNITPQKIFKKMNELFAEAIFVTDVGQHQMWATQCLELNNNRRLLTSGGLGTMGYGLPAAIGAGLGNPNTKIISISGDGGFQMTAQELATAVINELPLIICVFNNSYLGMVRQWQQLFYKRRYAITCLTRRKSCTTKCGGPNNCPEYTPNFIKLADSYGIPAIRIEKEEDIEKALIKASESKNTPTLLEFMIDMNEMVIPMVQGSKSLSEMILDI